MPRQPHATLLIALAAAASIAAAALISLKLYRHADHRELFLTLHGGLHRASSTLDEERNGHAYHTLRLESETGIGVEAALKTPLPAAQDGGPYPALVILGGLSTGRHTLEYLDSSRGLVLLCLDYPFEGKRERLTAWEFVSALPRMRRAVIETVPAVMLGVDYLLSRPEVDPRRIVLAGGSFGALFVPAAAAVDERIAAAAILFGAGDLESLVRANLDLPAPLAAAAAWTTAVLAAPVEPLKYVGDIAPRPLLMLGATGDARMPLENSRLLHEAAGEPKTIRWIDAGHLDVRQAEFHSLVGSALVEWLEAHDLARPGSLAGSTEGH